MYNINMIILIDKQIFYIPEIKNNGNRNKRDNIFIKTIHHSFSVKRFITIFNFMILILNSYF